MKNYVLFLAMAGSAFAGVLPNQPTQEQIKALAVFAEPMVPVGASSESDSQRLAAAVNAWAERSDADDYGPLENFLAAYPNSPWALAVRINLADTYYKSGRFRKALGTYEKAWNDSKQNKRGQELIIDIISVLVTHFANSFALFRGI